MNFIKRNFLWLCEIGFEEVGIFLLRSKNMPFSPSLASPKHIAAFVRDFHRHVKKRPLEGTNVVKIIRPAIWRVNACHEYVIKPIAIIVIRDRIPPTDLPQDLLFVRCCTSGKKHCLVHAELATAIKALRRLLILNAWHSVTRNKN